MVKRNNLRFFLIVLVIFVIGMESVRAQQADYISEEKIISSESQCSLDGYLDIGTFVDGNGQMVRHCIKKKPYNANDYFVVNSYFC